MNQPASSGRGFATFEVEAIFRLASELTGTCQEGRYRKDVLLSNVRQRMHLCGFDDLSPYLDYAAGSDAEYAALISALTIHTTDWFRESPHYDRIAKEMEARLVAAPNLRVRLLSLGTSSGEEVYSFGLMFEQLRERFSGFDYDLVGVDVDPVSIQRASRGVYPHRRLKPHIEAKYGRHMLFGTTANTKGLFTLCEEVRTRCRFQVASILNLETLGLGAFDFVVCRNVLIYFDEAQVAKVIAGIENLLAPGGWAVLGHSEALPPGQRTLRALGNALYTKPERVGIAKAQKHVLVVDDSSTTRRVIEKMLVKGDFAVSLADSAEAATNAVKAHKFDLITLDLHMPEKNGDVWLKEQRALGLDTPVTIVSGAGAEEAAHVLGLLENEAQDYIEKHELFSDSGELVRRIMAIIDGHDAKRRSRSRPKLVRTPSESAKLTLARPSLILVGASTGGTDALIRLLRAMPADSPPIVVVQHITPAFTRAFAQRLADTAGLTLEDPRNQPVAKPGHLYMAHGDHHMRISPAARGWRIGVDESGAVNGHRPSIDALFLSLLHPEASIMALLLTGMGSDGAEGLRHIKARGGMTLTQSEASCIVYGMPKAAEKLGASQYVGDISELRTMMERALKVPPRA